MQQQLYSGRAKWHIDFQQSCFLSKTFQNFFNNENWKESKCSKQTIFKIISIAYEHRVLIIILKNVKWYE